MNPVSSMQVVKYTPRTHFVLAVTNLRGKNLPNIHRITSPAYYVVVKVDDTEIKTTVSTKRNKSPSWEKVFKFAATNSSILRIKVYCAHVENSGEDHVVCETKEALQIGESLSRNEDVVCTLDVVHPRSREKDRTITLRLRVDSLTIPSSTDVGSLSDSTVAKEVPIPDQEYQIISERWKRLLTSLESFCLIAKDIAEIDPKAKVAVAAVSVVLKVITDQIKLDEKIDDLVSLLADLYNWLQDGKSLRKIRSFEETVIKLLKHTSECAYFIRKYYETYSFLRRAIENIGSEVNAKITQYQSLFDMLRIELILGTSLQTTLLSVEIFKKVTNIEIQTYLNRFPCLERTAFDPKYAAMRGTHLDTSIDPILDWVAGADKTEKPVFLLLGAAGSGKSSIAHFVARHFYAEKRLGCGIFLHGGIENRNSQRISGTIIRLLAQFDPAIEQRMSGPITNPDIALADIGRQFDELVVTPLENLEMVGPVLVIIDGLDGCGDAEDRSRVLSIFTDNSLMTRLPPNFRFLITSCPRQDIQKICMKLNHICHHTIPVLPNVEKNENLIRTTFNDLEVVQSPALEGYGIDRMRHEFLRRAGGDDIWTSVACRALQRSCLSGFADILLIRPFPATLQDSTTRLHASIFEAFITPPWIVHLRTLLLFGTDHVFYLVLISHEQDSEDIGDINQIARGLGIVIIPIVTSTNGSLRDVIADFLTHERHCIDHTSYVEQSLCGVAEACLDGMNGSLRHNMCGLSTTSHMDIEISGLTQLVEKHIPKDVQYAVVNWLMHILEIKRPSDALLKKLHELLFEHLLHWIEVLSVIGCLDEDKVCRSLQLLDEHISSHDKDGSYSKLCRMIKDATRFLRSYGSTICQAHLHTYISALPLFPSHTLLHKTYIGEVIDERPRISSNINTDPLYVVQRYSGDFNSITLSRSGSQVVCCDDAGTVRICNTKSGEEVHKLKGHSGSIWDAKFSPDGQRVASGGEDGTIHIWDVQTGRLINKLTHNDWVSCVEFSLDGSKLVGRSRNDIITWKSDTGDVIGKRQIKTYCAHATFSPDGQQIATTAKDKILIFDFKLENEVAALDGHKNLVQQIAWSLDASKLASSSKTETLLWDARQKSLIAVLDAKVGNITSLRFTANQLSLVTGIYYSGTLLHTWDINTPNHRITKLITRQDVLSADVRLDLGRVVVGKRRGGMLMWDIESLQTLSPKDIDDLLIISAHTPTITFHKPFNPLRLAHHVNLNGWLCTHDGQKIVWVSKCKPPYKIRRSTGKLEFFGHNDEIGLVMESSSIE